MMAGSRANDPTTINVEDHGDEPRRELHDEPDDEQDDGGAEAGVADPLAEVAPAHHGGAPNQDRVVRIDRRRFGCRSAASGGLTASIPRRSSRPCELSRAPGRREKWVACDVLVAVEHRPRRLAVGIGEEPSDAVDVAGVEPREAEGPAARRRPGSGRRVTGRRYSAASIGGLPKPSHVDGKAMWSAAA